MNLHTQAVDGIQLSAVPALLSLLFCTLCTHMVGYSARVSNGPVRGLYEEVHITQNWENLLDTFLLLSRLFFRMFFIMPSLPVILPQAGMCLTLHLFPSSSFFHPPVLSVSSCDFQTHPFFIKRVIFHFLKEPGHLLAPSFVDSLLSNCQVLQSVSQS